MLCYCHFIYSFYAVLWNKRPNTLEVSIILLNIPIIVCERFFFHFFFLFPSIVVLYAFFSFDVTHMRYREKNIKIGQSIENRIGWYPTHVYCVCVTVADVAMHDRIGQHMPAFTECCCCCFCVRGLLNRKVKNETKIIQSMLDFDWKLPSLLTVLVATYFFFFVMLFWEANDQLLNNSGVFCN